MRLTNKSPLQLFLLISGPIFLASALSMPTAITDPTYTTGTSTIISSNWGTTTPTSFSFNYQTTMSTSSLNGTLGVIGIDSYIRPSQWGWRMSILSLSQTSLTLNLNVKNSYSPILYLQICYLVTSNTLLELNWVAYSFSNTQPIANYFLSAGSCFIDCRIYTTTQAFKPKTGGKVIVFLSGFDVNNNPQNPNRNTYFGLTLEPTDPPNNSMSSSFSINITVYGGAEINYISYYYISFQPATLDIINSRLVTYGVDSIGCFYTPNTCNPTGMNQVNPNSNTTMKTGKTGVMSYTVNNFFFGVYRFIMNWRGDTTSIANTFRITSVSQNTDSAIKIMASFTGNTNNEFHLAFSYFTLQTFYCPTTGSDIYYVYNTNMCDSTCNTTLRQFANASNYCQPCGVYCYTCAVTANNCTSCYNDQNRAVINSTCSCDAGYYDNGNLVCPICHFSCKTCSNSGSSNCLSCQSSNYRYLNGNTCSCMVGYYQINSSSCSPCHYSCQTATCTTNTDIGCTSCNISKYRIPLANLTCGCNAGYYDNSTNTEECAPCHYSCMTCQGSNVICLTCNSANLRVLSATGNNCICQDGYYDGVALCSRCYSTCLTCNGPLNSNCLTCDTTLRTLAGSTCICGLRYYDSNNICSPCSYSCLNCTNSMPNGCNACNLTAYRILNTTTNTCSCMDGYYDVNIQLCSPCSSACFTCISSASTCTSCHNNPGRYYSGTAFSCLCSTGYVDLTFDGYCTPCHYSCLTCSGIANSCILCAANRIWDGVACICPDGTYDNGFNSTCQTCQFTCTKCTSGLSTSCTACDSTYLRYLSPTPTGSCICLASYYDSGVLFCQPCSSKCLTCWGSATNCTSCDSTINHRLISSSNTCDCAPGYVQVGLAICAACVTPCLTCSILDTNCTSCYSDRTLVSGQCVCLSGYFQNSSGLCQLCSYLCQTCTSLTSCLTCRIGTNRFLSANTCQCVTGYLQTFTSICSPCSYRCASCTGFDYFCSSCPVNSFRVLNSSSSCPCMDGYYENVGSPICLACYNLCLTCLSYSQCLSCNATTNRMWDSSNLSCPCITDYYDVGNTICESCHQSCTTCFGPYSTNCYTCALNRILTGSQCPCNIGYYELLGACTSCSVSCNTCLGSATNCTSCSNLTILSNNQCVCLPGYFLNANTCDLCDSSCLTCVSTATFCTGCNLLQGKVLNGSSCICQTNTFLNTSTLICQNCSFRCLTCSGASQNSCLSCDASIYRLINPTSFTCDCMPGYFENTSFICQLCVSPCLTCNGASTLNCTSCISGYILIGSSCVTTTICPQYSYDGFCVDSCPNTTYPLGNTCVLCTNNCSLCLSATYCLACKNGFIFYNNTCISICPNSTYNASNICVSCPSSCVKCVHLGNELVCLSCLNGYYLLNNVCSSQCELQSQKFVLVNQICIPCLYNCLTCSNISSNGCLTCSSSYYFYQGMCLNNCPQGYISNNSICVPCFGNCSICDTLTCQKCTTGFYLTKDGGCFPNGYFSSAGVVKKCHVNCLSCTDQSFSSCITCAQFRGDSSQMAISGYCDCWIGSLDLGNGTCDRYSYQSLKEFTEFLVTGTTSVNYFSILSGTVSINFMAGGLSVFYQQTYSNFYFINSSAVLQTDAVLDRYGDNSLIEVTKDKEGSGSTGKRFGRRLDQYTAQSLQDDQSLFMRGNSFEYLFDWGFIIFILTISLWIIKNIVGCISKRIKNKESKVFLVTKTIQSFLDQSALIILLIFTFNQVALYSLASFKIIAKKYHNSIDATKLILSCLFSFYYIFYLTKMFIVSLKDKPSKEHFQKYKALFGCFQASRLTKRACRIYLPLLLLRSLFLAVFIVALSFSAFFQTLLSLSTIFLWNIYSFFACPYPFYIRLFVRFHQILFTGQIGLLTLSTAFPEQSRLQIAIALMVLNFLQIFVFLCLGINIILYKLFNLKCFKRNQNVVKALENLQKQAIQRQKPLNQNTIEGLNGQDNKKQIPNKLFHGQIPYENSEASISIQNMEAGEKQTQNVTRKRYRVKRQQKF